jgi:DNA-binding response OmpR family regulator
VSRSSTCPILLVEDHHDTGRILSRLLRLSGYTVMNAATCSEARALAGREPCAVLLSDVRLPDGSGLDLMRELKDSRGVRGVAMSGYTDEADQAAALAAGFERHLPKPVTFDQVLDAVRAVSA